MRIVSSKLQKMARSGIREIMDLANRQTKAIHLEIGEPSFDTPAHISAAAVDALHSGFTKYTPNTGLLSLRETIQRKVARQNKIKAHVDQIAVSPGAVFSLAMAMAAVADPRDEILLPDPGWPNYTMQATFLGISPVYYPLQPENGFQPMVKELEPLISSRTRALVINSPSNPTGAVFTENCLGELLHLARRNDIYIISDEVYEDIVFDVRHHSLGSRDADGHVINIFGVSKAYAMTGWRIGYSIAPAHLAPHMHKMLEPFVSNAAAVSQKAAEAALDGPRDCIDEMVHAYRRRRDFVVVFLLAEGFELVVPQGTFYLLVDISSTQMDSDNFSRQLVLETAVAVAPGKTFGANANRFVRISYCAEMDTLRQGLTRFCQFFHSRCHAY